jgi:hypothetical protein
MYVKCQNDFFSQHTVPFSQIVQIVYQHTELFLILYKLYISTQYLFLRPYKLPNISVEQALLKRQVSKLRKNVTTF